LQPVSLAALLATLVLLFGFQGEQIVRQPIVIAILAVPMLIQVYLNAGLDSGRIVSVRSTRIPYCETVCTTLATGRPPETATLLPSLSTMSSYSASVSSVPLGFISTIL
jgi:ACR3 family arsenite efflux pump ArsB